MSAFKSRGKLNCPACHLTGFTETGLDLHLEKQCASSIQEGVISDDEAPIVKKPRVEDDRKGLYHNRNTNRKPAIRNIIPHQDVIIINDLEPVTDIKLPPLVPWSTLGNSIKKYRDKLSEYHIPNHGSKTELQDRYHRYRTAVLQNSQIPSCYRITAKEIVKKVMLSEVGRDKGVVKPNHGTVYKKDFESLIRDVKRRRE